MPVVGSSHNVASRATEGGTEPVQPDTCARGSASFMAVHQLLPRFHSSDPSALAAVELQILLRRLGQWGELYALEREERAEPVGQHAGALRVRPGDTVLLHDDRESPLAARLLHLPCRRGVVFHGLAAATGGDGAESLEAARAQLTGLAEPGALGIGLSEFAASELRRAGWTRVHAVPLYVEPERYGPDRTDAAMRARLDSPGLTVIGEARTPPEGGLEDLLRLHTELRRLRPDARLLLLGTDGPLPAAAGELRELARHEPGVRWLGALGHGERVAALRSSAV